MLDLRGCRVLLTRPLAQVEPWRQALVDAGATVVTVPVLKIAPLPMQVAPIRPTAPAPLFIFVSTHAVAYGLPRLVAAGWDAATLATAAIGTATTNALFAHGVRAIHSRAGGFDSEALLAQLAIDELRERGAVIVRGVGPTEGRTLIADTLVEAGVRVGFLECYRRMAEPTAARALADALAGAPFTMMHVLSVETMHYLLDALPQQGQDSTLAYPLFVPNARIAQAARAAGFKAVVECGITPAELVNTLHTYRHRDCH
jgi:uroporphyrinogen-III synthase